MIAIGRVLHRSMKSFEAIGLRMALAMALITVTVGSDDGFSISYFTCNDTWNPTIPSNTRVPLNTVCNMKLHVTSLRNETEATPGGVVKAVVALLVTAGVESLRTKNVLGVDYWVAEQFDVNLQLEGTTDVDLSQLTLSLPNICGQTYLIARIMVDGASIDQPTPIQLECREKSVNLAIVGRTDNNYDMYSQRPVIHTTGQPISYFIPGLKMWVQNAANDTFSARTGLSAFVVVVYIKFQQWYMYQWDVKNQSHQTVAHVDMKSLEFQMGDCMLNDGNELVPVQGGRGTPSLAVNYLLELVLDKLTLKSRAVSGNAILVFQLKVPFEPADSNLMNNFYFIPVFVDGWGHNPVHNIESCQVIPNYYDGGQTAAIVYSVAGQTTVYEYRSDERSVRKLNADQDGPLIQDVALMKLQIDINSKRLMDLGQCVDTLWGSMDCFVTLLDGVLADVRTSWDEVKTENNIQEGQYRKMKLILDSVCDLLTLILQPQNPWHDFLHLPFQAVYNPYYPNRGGRYNYDAYDSNRIKRQADESNSVGQEFETARVNEAPGQSLPMPTTSSPSLTAGQTAQNANSSTETTANLPGTSRGVTYTTTVTLPRTSGNESLGYSQEATTATTQGVTGHSRSTATGDSSSGVTSKYPSTATVTSSPLSTQQKTTDAAVTQSLTGTPRSNTATYDDSSADEDKAFGPKASWHRMVSDVIYELVKNGGEGYFILSKDRWHALSIICKTFLYGRKDDLERYMFIPGSLRLNMVTIFNMFANQNGPRIFDHIPEPLIKTMTQWFDSKWRQRRNFGEAACDYQEGLSLALNVTEDLLQRKDMAHAHDQLKMLSFVLLVLAKEDNTNYYAQMYSQLVSAGIRRHTWMIRDDVSIHEPTKEDVCKRCTAIKLWQLRKFPVFQFGRSTMSPDHYSAVFWTEENGNILRGDRSELTGQVFWTKVATCNCPNGATCDQSTTVTPAAPPKSMTAAPVVRNEAEMSMNKDKQNASSRQDSDVEAAEDLIFSD